MSKVVLSHYIEGRPVFAVRDGWNSGPLFLNIHQAILRAGSNALVTDEAWAAWLAAAVTHYERATRGEGDGRIAVRYDPTIRRSGFEQWRDWLADAQQRLGLDSLDGDEDVDGYSLDWAHDEFEARVSSAEFAASVRSHIASLNAH